MISLLIPLLARIGVPERLRRAAAIAITVIAVAALCGLLWTCWLNKHDAKVIDSHESGISEQITAATTAADEVANFNDAERRERDARIDESLREAIRDAEAKNPVEVRHDAGPATRATLERLRQRAAKTGPAAR